MTSLLPAFGVIAAGKIAGVPSSVAAVPEATVAPVLTCGIASEIPGFSARDGTGRYRGFEVEFCRELAAVRHGSREAVRFVGVPTLAAFSADPRIDLVVGGLTATAGREESGHLRFGPVYFHDGQRFVAREALQSADVSALSGQSICVSEGTRAAANLQRYFAEHRLQLLARLFTNDATAWAAFERGECVAYSADVVEITKGMASSPHPEQYAVLDGRISVEPLAPVLREDDAVLLAQTRRVLRDLIVAETNGVQTPHRSYAAIYDRTLGALSPYRLPRGDNRLVREGGLLEAPPD